MGKEIFELLARFGLKNPSDLGKVSNLSSKEVHALHQKLWDALFRLQYEGAPRRGEAQNEAQTFRFVASRHLRGDTCYSCRTTKIQFLARFAALYSDLVIVPLSLQRHSKVKSLAIAKGQIRDAVESLLMLRPLILAGIVRPAVMTTLNCCELHAGLLKEFSDLTHSIADDIAVERLSDFKVYYEPPAAPGFDCVIYIEGPKDYLEHGGLVVRTPKPPSWVAKSWRADANGRMAIPPQKIHRLGFVHEILDQIAGDTTFHFAYGSLWGAKYLTDLPGEAALLRGLRDQVTTAEQNRARTLVASMAHALPFVGDLSISEILKIRSEISEAFEQYRWALAAILRDHRAQHLTTKEAGRICVRELAPKIAALENKVAVERRRFRNKVMATSGIVGIVVTLGLFGLMQTSEGCDLLGGALMALTGLLAESRTPVPAAATDDLYFLLRMKQSGRGRSRY